MSERIDLWVKNGRRFGNGLTFDELSKIEEHARRGDSDESRIILRLAAALREAMQIVESALAVMGLTRYGKEKDARSVP
jgi:hypothetical protein